MQLGAFPHLRDPGDHTKLQGDSGSAVNSCWAVLELAGSSQSSRWFLESGGEDNPKMPPSALWASHEASLEHTALAGGFGGSSHLFLAPQCRVEN